ncbi:MAG: hypothetical protein LBC74_03950 [Planctomycetaceae bacterium]|nr:hypothetical protein [Planctomycetaceae bacterium]
MEKEFWATKCNLTDKGWNIRAVRKTTLSSADYWAWVTELLPIKKHTTE